MRKSLVELAKPLVQPHSSISRPGERRILQLAASWHLFTLPMGPVLALLQSIQGSADRTSLVWAIGSPLVCVVNYLLTRSRHGLRALWAQILLSTGIIFWVITIRPYYQAVYLSLLFPVLMAAIVSRLRPLLVFQSFLMVVLLLRYAQVPTDVQHEMFGSLFVLSVCFLAISVLVHQNRWLQRLHEKQLRQESNRARAILDSVFDGTAVLQDGQFTEVSAGFAACFLREPSELLGQRLEDSLPALQDQVLPHPQLGNEDVGSLRSPEPQLIQVKKDSLRYLRIVSQPLYQESVQESVIAVQDCTLEQQVRSQQQWMDRMVSLGTIATGVAHEVNNALSALMGHQELASLSMRGGEQLRAEQHLKSMGTGLERIRSSVSSLQRLGSREEWITVLNLSEVIQSTLRLLAPSIPPEIHIEVELEPAALVKGVDSWIGQILMNLVLNAQYALMGSGHKSPLISIHTQVLDDQQVALRVRDNGPGIPESLRGKIFQAYFTTKPSHLGSGLGLSICMTLAQRLGGQLALESGEGGACFRLTLPLTAAEEPALESRPARPSQARRPRSSRVLIIEDEPGIRQYLREVFSDCEVLDHACVEDAQSSWEGDYDLILCDLVLPGASGMDFCSWLLQHHPEELRKVLLMSGGLLKPEHEVQLHSLPELPLLQKPFTMAQLQSAADSILSSAPS